MTRKSASKRGGEQQRIEFDANQLADVARDEKLLALDEALDKLAAESSEKAELVKLRYFAGLSHQEAAQSLGVSRATADRYWAYAKVFLHCEMEGHENP